MGLYVAVVLGGLTVNLIGYSVKLAFTYYLLKRQRARSADDFNRLLRQLEAEVQSRYSLGAGDQKVH